MPVGRGKSDQFSSNRFYVPGVCAARSAEIQRQPIEQFLIRGLRALRAKVVARLHESAAEHHLPEAIHRDARHERVSGLQQPLREAEPIRRLVRRKRRKP